MARHNWRTIKEYKNRYDKGNVIVQISRESNITKITTKKRITFHKGTWPNHYHIPYRTIKR